MQLRLLLHTIKSQACRHGALLVMCIVVSLTVIILFQHVAYLFFSLWRYLQQICCMIEEVHVSFSDPYSNTELLSELHVQYWQQSWAFQS